MDWHSPAVPAVMARLAPSSAKQRERVIMRGLPDARSLHAFSNSSYSLRSDGRTPDSANKFAYNRIRGTLSMASEKLNGSQPISSNRTTFLRRYWYGWC